MAGLLETFGLATGDPKRDASLNYGLIQAGLSLLNSRGNFGSALGQAGQAGLLGSQQFGQQQHQRQLQQWQADEMKRRQAMQALPGQFARTPAQTALAAGGGPTVQNAQAMQTAGPSFDYAGYTDALAQYDPVQALSLKAQLSQRAKPTILSEGQIAFDENGKPMFSGPAKQPAPTEIGRLYSEMMQLPPNDPRRAAYQQAITKATTHRPGTSVNVNTGQKGFDNTLKLRGDWRSEPIYKAHQDVQSAHAQIKASLKANSAIGDTAAATKIMKILDPGSVVRESELGMALAATGLFDRVSNYADKIIKGELLNPKQRQDFAALADALFAESAKAYNAKRGEYESIAQRNQLNVPDVVGPAGAAPQGAVIDFGSLP